jgi:MOSC domain-containing protein YiiM
VPQKRSRLFSWLAEWCAEELQGTLTAIFVTDQAGRAMRSVSQVEAIAGRGLAGDRYADGNGHWRHTDACQVTLVTEEDLGRAARKSGISFAAGQHRRNLVVAGIPLEAFRGRPVRIGTAVFAYHRLRPPCGYLDRLVQRGAGKALGRGAGIGLHVIEGGGIAVGDRVEVIDEVDDH